MHRFYVDQLVGTQAELSREDLHHAWKVLRLSAGDKVELICHGERYEAVLRDNGIAEVLKILPPTEAGLQITLFQGLPKSDKMDWIVQKAVEIGVVRIVPVIMARCVVRVSPQDGEKKHLRWAKIAREAGKQSGRCLLPEILPTIPLSSVLDLSVGLDACIVPWEESSSIGPGKFAAAHPDLSSLGILIGPEGGIESSEICSLKPVFQPITLGPRILRTETAGLVACAAMMALRGEMEGA